MGWPGPLTHRQFEAWNKWRFIDVNTPERAEWYLMQIACEVKKVLAKDPGLIKIENFKLPFQSPETAEQSQKKAKLERTLEMMHRGLVRRGGFSKAQIKEIMENARRRLEGDTDG